MNVKTVSVHYGRKHNLGDYNSANVECTIWADVEEGENLNRVMGDLWEMAKNNVRAQLVPLAKGNGSMKTEEIFLGLPKELQQAAGYPPAPESEAENGN